MNKYFKIYRERWNKDFPDISEAVSIRKVKSNYLAWSVALGLLLALLYVSWAYGKQTDRGTKKSFQNIEVIQPIKTSSQRIILQGE